MGAVGASSSSASRPVRKITRSGGACPEAAPSPGPALPHLVQPGPPRRPSRAAGPQSLVPSLLLLCSGWGLPSRLSPPPPLHPVTLSGSLPHRVSRFLFQGPVKLEVPRIVLLTCVSEKSVPGTASSPRAQSVPLTSGERRQSFAGSLPVVPQPLTWSKGQNVL